MAYVVPRPGPFPGSLPSARLRAVHIIVRGEFYETVFRSPARSDARARRLRQRKPRAATHDTPNDSSDNATYHPPDYAAYNAHTPNDATQYGHAHRHLERDDDD